MLHGVKSSGSGPYAELGQGIESRSQRPVAAHVGKDLFHRPVCPGVTLMRSAGKDREGDERKDEKFMVLHDAICFL